MALDTANAIVTLRGLTAKFDNNVRAATPFYPKVCTVRPSKGADEQYAWLGNMPGMREWLGDRIFNELRAAHYTIVNKKWESSIAIDKDHIDDDRLGIYDPVFEQLGTEAAFHPDELWFTTLLAGETTACYDAQYFFDTDHAWGDSGTQSNLLTYNAADHTAVTTAEFKAALDQAVRTMLAYKNDQGKYFNRPVINSASGLCVMVPLALRKAAYEARDSLVLSNSTNVVIDTYDIVVSPSLTAATDWYLFKTDTPMKPFVFQPREPLSRQMKGTDDIEFKDVKFMTQARYNLGFLAWWNAVLTRFN